MASMDIKAFAKKVGEYGLIFGLDVGAKTIGIASGSLSLGVATPLETIKRVKFTKDMDVLKKLAQEFDVKGFVVGLPVSMDGTEGRRCQSIRDFSSNMQDIFPHIPVLFWDERLSTETVENFVGNFVNVKKAKKKGTIDMLAAQHILQGALDHLAYME